jgi:hypothetical protein
LSRLGQRVLVVQGAYYMITGLWPLIHLSSFEAVTGPKTDHWLVRTVGLLAAAIGLALLAGARRRETGTTTLPTLALSSALAFAAVDVWYGLRGVISPIYLADGVIQLGWVAFGCALVIKRTPGRDRAT